MDELLQRIKKFRNDRDWEQFHTPENLAKSIIIEAAELLENFQWNNEYDLENVKDEIADVMTYCFMLADFLDIDMIENMHRKIDQNELKYPVDQVKGSSKKYTEYKNNLVKDESNSKENIKDESKDKQPKEEQKEDRGSAEMFDLEENPWGDDDYLGDNPYPHFG